MIWEIIVSFCDRQSYKVPVLYKVLNYYSCYENIFLKNFMRYRALSYCFITSWILVLVSSNLLLMDLCPSNLKVNFFPSVRLKNWQFYLFLSLFFNESARKFSFSAALAIIISANDSRIKNQPRLAIIKRKTFFLLFLFTNIIK